MNDYNDGPYCGTCLRYLHEDPCFSLSLARFKRDCCPACNKPQAAADDPVSKFWEGFDYQSCKDGA